MVAHNCHGKTKNLTAKTKYLTAKPKTSRQKQNTSLQNQIINVTLPEQNKIPHGKTKNLTAKPNTSQQKQNSFGFCCEVVGFAVRSLVLPWGFRFCRDSCGPPYLCNSAWSIRHKIKETLLSNNCCFSRPALQFPLMTYLNQFRALYS